MAASEEKAENESPRLPHVCAPNNSKEKDKVCFTVSILNS